MANSIVIPAAGGGSGTPGGASGSAQYNDAGAFGGFGSWDGDALRFGAGTGLAFDGGVANPITVLAGDDGGGDSAIVIDNPTDNYIVIRVNRTTDITFGDSYSSLIEVAEGSIGLIAPNVDVTGIVGLTGDVNVTGDVQLSGSITVPGTATLGTIIPTTAYKSVDGSTGATGTATAANTLTIKNGLIVAIT